MMKRMMMAALALAWVGSMGSAAEERDRGDGASRESAAQAPARASAPPPRQALVINMGRGSSGGSNRNYASQRPGQAQPSWGHMQRVQPPVQAPRSGFRAQMQAPRPAQPMARAEVNAYGGPGLHAAQAVQHHPYTQGYVRKKLERLGVKSEPAYITDRAEMVHTDRSHSSIPMPSHGIANARLGGALIGPRGAAAAVVGAQMARISSPAWRDQVEGFNRSENRSGRYYWHHDSGFDYCHYLDGSGYHWYGWYMGDQYFWTRQFNSRWWWYDTDQDRWTFYNDGFFWWQDPYHVGELYCYNDGTYIPVNSQDDQVVVTHPDDAPMKAFNSPDGTRSVKLMAGNDDAFLYDASAQPSFSPVYLASGVQSVEFSSTGNGRPLEIILLLNDGSFDLFDGQGRSYGPSQNAVPDDDGAEAPAGQ